MSAGGCYSSLITSIPYIPPFFFLVSHFFPPFHFPFHLLENTRSNIAQQRVLRVYETELNIFIHTFLTLYYGKVISRKRGLVVSTVVHVTELLDFFFSFFGRVDCVRSSWWFLSLLTRIRWPARRMRVFDGQLCMTLSHGMRMREYVGSYIIEIWITLSWKEGRKYTCEGIYKRAFQSRRVLL